MKQCTLWQAMRTLLHTVVPSTLLQGRESVSEWLLFSAKLTMFQLFHGDSKLYANEMMMASVLY